ncbi:hypothetical protein [Providencia rettgeri]|uniref:hypothetical protein n=1 Tax=Providencia rettgeri TaxID=587 RepID=UPI0023AAF856|nr:hypothetical protein [Providencia rettgeri]
MLGFVSALSASVSVMILLMAVLLANVMSSAMDMEKNKNKAQLLGIEDSNKKNNKINNNMTSLTFNNEVLDKIDHEKVKKIEIYCSYGNNLTLDAALTYTVYNTIYLKRNIPKVDIHALNPVEDNNGENSCFLKSQKHEKK